MLRQFPLLLASLIIAACSSATTDPTILLDDLPYGLAVEFTMDPVEVGPHDPFSVSLSLTNTTNDTITIVTPNHALAMPRVVRDGERILFRGSDLGFFPVVTTRTFAPGEQVTRTWELRAELMSMDDDDEIVWLPAEPGAYLVQVEFQVGAVDERPLTEGAELVVR